MVPFKLNYQLRMNLPSGYTCAGIGSSHPPYSGDIIHRPTFCSAKLDLSLWIKPRSEFFIAKINIPRAPIESEDYGTK